MMTLDKRHPSTQHFEKLFAHDHFPPNLQPTSQACHDLAKQMIQRLLDGPELSVGLRKLLEA